MEILMKINPITVTELNMYVKDKVAEDEFLNSVLVKGEISNFKHHYTGHMYFTLKDENSLIKCVMFKSSTVTLNFAPKDGMKVIVLGTVGVYERDGVYQIYCKAMQEDGMGSLYVAFEKLKAKLEQEGLFDESHKKKIPFMPKIIGVLTSNTGAVIRDIINVSTRRNPNVYIRLLPVPVQGEGAAEKIVKAIELMNEKKLADCLILARGGGSLEDLWPFNEEIVARAIYYSELPIISAVGHETDFTIADFVADLRAPTPSAAAELVVTDISELEYNINLFQRRLRMALKRKTEVMRLRYEKCLNSKVYKEPLQKVSDYYLEIDRLMKSIENSTIKKLKDSRLESAKLITKLDTLSPLKTLTRGYCLTESNGNVITKAEELKKDMEIDLKFQDGTAKAKII
jgi:exodeoxyribonuclease VII large subunit